MQIKKQLKRQAIGGYKTIKEEDYIKIRADIKIMEDAFKACCPETIRKAFWSTNKS